MKRSTKYVALDVHQATTVASVREEGGRVIARAVLPTEAVTPRHSPNSRPPRRTRTSVRPASVPSLR